MQACHAPPALSRAHLRLLHTRVTFCCHAGDAAPYPDEEAAQWDDSVASKRALGGAAEAYAPARGAIAATAAVRIALVATVLLAGAWTAQQRSGAHPEAPSTGALRPRMPDSAYIRG